MPLWCSFEDPAIPDGELQLPPEAQAGLDGLDLPSLDDLLWQDSICNGFGVPYASRGAAGHQAGACQDAGCRLCVRSSGAAQAPASPALSIPWNEDNPDTKSQQQGHQQQAVSESSSPLEALIQSPPQTERVQQAAPQEPTSSRDSNPTHLSPQSSCDLPENGLKRRRADESSPECCDPACSSEGKSAITAAGTPPQVGLCRQQWSCMQATTL